MEEFMSEIESYAKSRGIKPATVLQLAARLSGRTWERWLQGDASCTLRTMSRVRDYMRENPVPAKSSAKDAA
jgi:hypothetical protein